MIANAKDVVEHVLERSGKITNDMDLIKIKIEDVEYRIQDNGINYVIETHFAFTAEIEIENEDGTRMYNGCIAIVRGEGEIRTWEEEE